MPKSRALPLLLATALTSGVAATISRQRDFCATSCACPWQGKAFPVASGATEEYQAYPNSYVVYKVATPPVVDGSLDDEAWAEVDWTDQFLDISEPNPGFPVPRFETKAKMRWDDDFLYVGA